MGRIYARVCVGFIWIDLHHHCVYFFSTVKRLEFGVEDNSNSFLKKLKYFFLIIPLSDIITSLMTVPTLQICPASFLGSFSFEVVVPLGILD